MKTPVIILLAALFVLVLVGAFLPLGTYTFPGGTCEQGKPSVVRLDMLRGDSVKGLKAAGAVPAPNASCGRQTNYRLYAL
jgi:hypothetical protein